jgi:hypothetical protein
VLPPGAMRDWRGGAWRQGRYHGRDGWWWVVGNSWYYYPRPVYPHPLVVSNLIYANPLLPPVAAAMWYYCPFPQGYYPYVPQCQYPWQPVPAY